MKEEINESESKALQIEWDGSSVSDYCSTNSTTFYFLFITSIGCLFIFSIPLITFIAYGILSKIPRSLSIDEFEQLTYTFQGEVMTVGTKQETDSILRFTTTVVLHCIIKDDETQSMIFMTDLYDTLFQTIDAIDRENVLNEQSIPGKMTYSMYFNQSFDGEILEVIQSTEEDDEILSIKLNVINTFQTKFGRDNKGKKLKFYDSNGFYEVGIKSDDYKLDYVIEREYTQGDFKEFSDEDVKQYRDDKTFQFLGKSYHYLNAVGKFWKIVVEQNSEFSKDPNGKGHVHSRGICTAELNDTRIVPYVERKRRFLSLNHKEIPNISTFSNRRDVKFLSFLKGNLLDIGKYIIQGIKIGSWLVDPGDIQGLIDEVLGLILTEEQIQNAFSIARQLVKLFKSKFGNALFNTYFKPILTTGSFYPLSLNNKDLIYYILTSFGSSVCQTEFIVWGLRYSGTINKTLTKIHAVMSSRNLADPTQAIVDELLYMYNHETQKDLKNSAFLSHFILKERLPSTKRREIQSEVLEYLQKEDDQSNGDIMIKLYVMKDLKLNLPLEEFYRLKKRNSDKINKLAFKLLDPIDHIKVEKIDYHRRMVENDQKDYPFHFTDSFDKEFDSDYASAKFHGEYFAGTNLGKCNTEWFNYKSSAFFYGDAEAFGMKQRVVNAKAEYGKKDGEFLDNELLLEIWDQTVYQKEIPSFELDCSKRTMDLYHFAKGWSAKYTVIIVYVPVTFEIGVDAYLDVTWGYEICDSNLYAMTEIIPKATVSVLGNAHINLLLLKGGVEVSVSFNALIIPVIHVSGTHCNIGVDVDLIVNPFVFEFYLFYMTRKLSDCTYVFPASIECPWGQKQISMIYEWSSPTIGKKLFSKSWDIK